MSKLIILLMIAIWGMGLNGEEAPVDSTVPPQSPAMQAPPTQGNLPTNPAATTEREPARRRRNKKKHKKHHRRHHRR